MKDCGVKVVYPDDLEIGQWYKVYYHGQSGDYVYEFARFSGFVIKHKRLFLRFNCHFWHFMKDWAYGTCICAKTV